MVIASNVMPYDNFIDLMNKKALSLKMTNSTFENPHGLNDDTKNYSTAYDMALLMKYAINNKEFLEISSSKKYKTKSNLNEYIWYNKNDLLTSYKYNIAGKIGYTNASGPVFVSASKKDGKTLIIVSIDESDKFNLHKRLYEEYFNIYDRYKVLDEYSFSINDDRYKNYYMYVKNDVNLLLRKDEVNKLNIVAKINNKLSNNIAGEIYFKLDDIIIYKEKLYYLEYETRKNKVKKLLFGMFLR